MAQGEQMTGDRIVQLPFCLRNTSSANDISANSIEPYAAEQLVPRSLSPMWACHLLPYVAMLHH